MLYNVVSVSTVQRSESAICVHVSEIPGDATGKEPACQCRGCSRDAGLTHGSGRYPGEGHAQLTPIFLLGESHGQRSLAGYSPQGLKRVRHN